MKKTLGQQLVAAAASSDISKAELAQALHVVRATVYNWAAGGPVSVFYRRRAEKALAMLQAGAGLKQLTRTFADL